MKFVSILVTGILSLSGVAQAQTSSPTAAQTQAARARGPCSDPWVTIALETVYGRVPDRRHCVIGLYAGGRWSSYDQLLSEVRSKSYSFQPVRIVGEGRLAGMSALGVFSGGALVAAGGGNLVAAGGGNLVAAGGGNLVAAGGGNILYINGNSFVSPGGRYSLQSTDRVAPVIN